MRYKSCLSQNEHLLVLKCAPLQKFVKIIHSNMSKSLMLEPAHVSLSN
jgi:hypothetical protein